MKRAATVLLLGLAACSSTESQLWGAGAGAASGGTLARIAATGAGAPWAFTGIGVVAGAAIGYAVGDYLDPPAQRLWAASTIKAAETGVTGQPVRWQTDSHQGSVAVTGAGWTDGGGRPCRPLHQEAWHKRDMANPYSRDVVACRFGDGTWEVRLPAPDSDDPAVRTPGS
ncbi:Surface antigen [Candidatus Terasakiella magnetica]|nr:Surface antigen [Candidatus Terasakiella magnetica]